MLRKHHVTDGNMVMADLHEQVWVQRTTSEQSQDCTVPGETTAVQLNGEMVRRDSQRAELEHNGVFCRIWRRCDRL